MEGLDNYMITSNHYAWHRTQGVQGYIQPKEVLVLSKTLKFLEHYIFHIIWFIPSIIELFGGV